MWVCAFVLYVRIGVASLQLRLHGACAGRRCAFDSRSALEEKDKRATTGCGTRGQNSRAQPLQSRATGPVEDSSLESVSLRCIIQNVFILSVLLRDAFREIKYAFGAVSVSIRMRGIQSRFSHGNRWWCGFSPRCGITKDALWIRSITRNGPFHVS